MQQMPKLPPNVRLLAPREQLDFFDYQSVTMRRPVSPLEAWNIIMDRPQPLLKAAFKVRDRISSFFGVKQIGGFSGAARQSVEVGDRLDFFLVEEASPDCLVLTERDRHLDVMTCVSTRDHDLAITSSVKTHNGFGKAYMLPVAPAHKVIVRGMLRYLESQAV